MAFWSFLQLPVFAFELSPKITQRKQQIKQCFSCGGTHVHMQNVHMCVYLGMLWGCGGGACILKGLVQCVRRPFWLLSSQTKLCWRGSLQQDMAAGGRRAAAALQPHLPAGEGYLSHLVHSSGLSIPSTTTYREGHIWPYLSMCTTVFQNTMVELQKAK